MTAMMKMMVRFRGVGRKSMSVEGWGGGLRAPGFPIFPLRWGVTTNPSAFTFYLYNCTYVLLIPFSKPFSEPPLKLLVCWSEWAVLGTLCLGIESISHINRWEVRGGGEVGRWGVCLM